MSRHHFTSLLLFISPMICFAQLQPTETPNNGTNGFQPNLKPLLQIQRIAAPIQIDGELNEPAWQAAVKAFNFSEHRPGDQTRPPVDTEALLAYDDTHLYLALIAHDDPKSIRYSLRDRDEIWQDDNIGMILDTYGDGAWAYEIFTNPLGIQGDIRWTPQGEDTGFNIVYDSKGKITETGFQVEMAIPFSSLRFPDRPIQMWRATFWRNHPRSSRGQYSWATISRDDPCFPCQFGTLTGIENVKPGGKLELLPSVIGFQSGTIRDSQIPHSGLENSKIDGEASLGVQYSFSPSLTAQGTYNPDFSQVESDAAQIDVNTTFALFYPERRPFFQEGSDLFDSFYRAFYTRSINNPQFAGKITGRMNRMSLAYLVGRDENSPIIIPLEERSGFISGGKGTSNILRLRRNFLEDSYIGGLITDRRLDGGGAGTMAGVDGVLRFKKNYRLEAQVLFSRTKEPNDTTLTENIVSSQRYFERGKHTVAFDGESFNGNAVYASFERDARLWNFDFDYYAASPSFRADNGFVTSNDNRQLIFWNGLFFYPNNKILDQVSPRLTVGRFWNSAGVRKDDWIRPAVFFQFKAQTSLWLGSVFSRERFREVVIPGIRRIEIEVNSNFSSPLTAGFWLSHGRFIARREDPPVLGRGTDFQAWATIKPLQQLIIQPEFAYFTLDHPDGHELVSQNVLRTRINYQFTRELFLRLIVQYSQQETAGKETGKGLSIEPLLSYKLNPFTIFYAGFTNQSERLYDNNSGAPLSSDLIDTQRQFFMKFQYLVQI